jgi:hypothetical protein
MNSENLDGLVPFIQGLQKLLAAAGKMDNELFYLCVELQDEALARRSVA